MKSSRRKIFSTSGESRRWLSRMRALGPDRVVVLVHRPDAEDTLLLLDGAGARLASVPLPSPGSWALPLPVGADDGRLVLTVHGPGRPGGAWILGPNGEVEAAGTASLPGEPQFYAVVGARLWLISALHVVCVELNGVRRPPGKTSPGSPDAPAGLVQAPIAYQPGYRIAGAREGDLLVSPGPTVFNRAVSGYCAEHLCWFELDTPEAFSTSPWGVEASGQGLLAHGVWWMPTGAGLWRAERGQAPRRVHEVACWSVVRTASGVLASAHGGLVLLDATGALRARMALSNNLFSLLGAGDRVLGAGAGVAAIQVDDEGGRLELALGCEERPGAGHTFARLDSGALAVCRHDRLLVWPADAGPRVVELAWPATVAGAGTHFITHPDVQASVPPPADYNSYTGESSEPPAVTEARFAAFYARASIAVVDGAGSVVHEVPAYPKDEAPPSRLGRTTYAGDSTGDAAVRTGRGVLYAPERRPGELWLWAWKG